MCFLIVVSHYIGEGLTSGCVLILSITRKGGVFLKSFWFGGERQKLCETSSLNLIGHHVVVKRIEIEKQYYV
jgi:hypothetical protein